MDYNLKQLIIAPNDANYNKKIAQLLKARTPQSETNSDVTKTVRAILQDVIDRGDEAVCEYTKKFDHADFDGHFLVPKEEIEKAHKDTDEKLLAAIRKAIENVRTYQQRIFIGKDQQFEDGTGIRYTPLRRVGCCIPGAAAPLPSTVIMTAVPAIVAGVEQIVIISPPRYQGSIHPVILAVCKELGIFEVYRIGGVQAVAALACGTERIEKVDKIVGPGNTWVQTAKKLVGNDYVGIDSIAGPSEVLIVANDEGNPEWIAMDMLSQAEHAEDSSAIVITDSKTLAEKIIAALESHLQQLPRAEESLGSLKTYSAVIVVDSMEKAIQLADDFAAEHLQIQCGENSKTIAAKIRNAGAIFVGNFTPVAVGDYWAGPSHTLPTERRARFSSALTSNDFVKSISIVEYSQEKLNEDGPDIVNLAELEGLDAHARSVQLRIEKD